MVQYVAYTRVSTRMQSASGLGLEGQLAAINRYASGNLVATFSDVASGADANRPGLAEAIEHCRKHRATLLVARLDRVARDMEILASVTKRCAVVAADTGPQDRLVLDILGAVAAAERRSISARTKAALAAKKQRGTRCGHLPTLEAHRARGNDTQKAAAVERAEAVREIVIQTYGATRSYRETAARLTRWGVGGRRWSGVTVKRALGRLAAA